MFSTTTYKLGPLHLRINPVVLTCVLITAAAFVRLGIWQLDRAAEKVAAQTALEAELAATAAPIESIPPAELRADNQALQNRFVMLQGEYLNHRTILLLAEFLDGQIGYAVITPLRLHSNGQLALINRGWTTGILPQGAQPSLRPVSGPVKVGAQIHLPQPALSSPSALSEPSASSVPREPSALPEPSASPAPEPERSDSLVDSVQWPLRVRTLNIPTLAQIFGEPLFPLELRITPNQPGTLARHWPAVNADASQHLFYALQWFLFAALVLIASLFASSNLWHLLRRP